MSDSVITWDDIKDNPNARKVLDKGFVYLKSVYGTDDTVCEAARISYGKGTKSVSDNRGLIRYLLAHHHNSPVEQCAVTFIVKLPIFAQGQLVRHRTAKLNQYSGRYSVMPDEYYFPEKFSAQSKTNKQGTDSDIPLNDTFIKKEYVHGCEHVREIYDRALSSGVAREQARIILPQNQYTLVIYQFDLHNLMHMLKLRMDSHAQWEIREYANAIYSLVKEKFPICMEAFDDYVLNAKTFSAPEMALMKSAIGFHNLDTVNPEDFKMTKREFTEFRAKMGL